ncbi:MAG: acyl-CoA dehydrogenase family protein [Acidimicrobiales bacterium]
MGDVEAGRAALARWWQGRPVNWFDATPNLEYVLALRAGRERTQAMLPRLRRFGEVAAGAIEPAVAELERHRELPALQSYDGIGRRVEAIEFHPAYGTVGEAAWGSGLMATGEHGEGVLEQAALFYLLAHAGEGGQACPIVCTVGLARALAHRASPELGDRYLPRLLSTDYRACFRGSQFLTEVQGGSDVGANAARALPDPTEAGAWRLTGEKWFCSVADADLFAVTARPEGAGAGTRGLGCFLVPRLLENGEPNGFRIRRLKDKLGTRALASGEIDLDDAIGWPIGPVEQGFHVAVEELLDTSRWLNAVGSTGIMRRAVLEASSFARHREAFGRAIGTFPAVRERIALMKADEQAALASTFALTSLLDLIDRGIADGRQRAAYRLLVNGNKYVTAIDASDVVHRAIEVLGGNGTIEDFSPLPRLYRDAVVFESWEGTHDVLSAQVQRDCARLALLKPVADWTRDEVAAGGDATGTDGAAILSSLEALVPRLERAVAGAERSAAAFRRLLERLMRAVQGACLLAEAAAGEERGEKSDEKRAVAALFVRHHLVPGHTPEDDQSWEGLVETALAGDAG